MPEALVLLLLCGFSPATGSESGRYPAQVLESLAGRVPFQPDETAMPHEFALVPLRDVARGNTYASAIRMMVEPLGEKLLLLDTAAGGLLLKEPRDHAMETIIVPGWAERGPGIQTGRFAILGRLASGELALGPAVAELFDGNGFPWVDGILSTGVFNAWVARLDFRKKRLLLLPFNAGSRSPGREWPCRLERNWWIAEVRLNGRTARMLLDSGAPRTYLSETWLRSEAEAKGRTWTSSSTGSGGYSEAGVREISISGVGKYTVSCLVVAASGIPATAAGPLDGAIGYDLLGGLALDLDYRAARVRTVTPSGDARNGGRPR